VSVFWEWAIEAYARPGVLDACLELQDAHGQSVPLMLWVLWARADGRSADLAQGARLAADYEAAAGGRLREARRALKQPIPGLGDGERLALRHRVKDVELEGERTLMAALAMLAPARPGGQPAPAAEALARASEAYGASLAAHAFEPLLARL
jgi:uncharacterized protein (TIGR02444 family)